MAGTSSGPRPLCSRQQDSVRTYGPVLQPSICPQTASLTTLFEIPLTGPEVTAPRSETPPWEPGRLLVGYWHHLVKHIVFGRASWPSRTFYGTFRKYRIIEMHRSFRSTPKRSLCGVPFSDRHPQRATKLPSGPDSLRAENEFRKIPSGTSSGQPPTGVCPQSRYLSAKVRSPQTPPLTRFAETSLTGPEATATVQQLLAGGAAVLFLDTGVIAKNTSSSQKTPPGISPGQPPTRSFQNIRPGPPGRYLSTEVPSNAPLTKSVETPLTGPKATATVQKLLPGGARRPLLGPPASSFVARITYSKGLPGRDDPSKRLFTRNSILEMHQKFLAQVRRPFWGMSFWDRRSWGAIRLPPCHDSLRTADALRPERVQNTWPARRPGQPRTGSFQNIWFRPPGRRRLDSFRPYNPVLRAGIRRPRYAALKRPPSPGPLRYL